MFIRELQLDGYGALQGLKLQLEAPVTVIYGPNEAGKSTVLRFVRSMLYGFPTRKDPVERGEPVHGGRHGGRLVLTDLSGQEYVLERYADRGSGLILRDDSGLERSMGQAEWERLMLGGISERLFRQLFAVSLNELHELRSLQGEEIGNYLYHAGLAGGAALTAARRKLGSELDRLYRPRGTNQEMNRLLADMKEIETSIRQSRDGIQAYNDTRDALLEAQTQFEWMEQSLPTLRMETAMLQGAYELREWWLKREALRLEEITLREQLPNPAAELLTEETVIAWSELKSKRMIAEDKLQKAKDHARDVQLMRDQLFWNEQLAATLPEWERLEALREGMVARRDEVTEQEAERRTLEETVRGTLSRISGVWGEEELRTFGGMAAEREQARRMQQSWEDAEQASLSLKADIRRIVRQQEVLETEAGSVSGQGQRKSESVISAHSGNESPYGLFVPQTRAALLRAWHNLEDARRSYDRVRTNVKQSTLRTTRSNNHRTSGEQSSLLLYAVAGLLGIIAILLLVILGSGGIEQPWIYVSCSSLLFLLAAGTVLLASRRSSVRAVARNDSQAKPNSSSDDCANTMRTQRKQVADKLRQLIEHPEASAARLIPDDQELNSDEDLMQTEQVDQFWSQLREAVYEQLARLEKDELGQSKQQELESRIQELRLERELLERDALKQDERLDELHTQWQLWLQARKLPSHLMPETLPELLGLAEQGQAVLRQLQRVKDRLELLNGTLEEYEQAAIRLFKLCPPPATIRSDVIQAVKWLYLEAAKQQVVKEEALRLEGELQSAEAMIQEAQQILTLIEKAAASLLQEVHVDSEAELELTIRIDERCTALRKEAREIGIRLESGRNQEARAQLYELLNAHDEAALAAILNEGKMKLAEEEVKRTEILDRRGRLAQELERLQRESEIEDKRLQLGEWQSKLEQLSERYAVLALADHLILQTKAVFEEEKQPEVLQRSSQYLQQMTNGAYIRIIAPGDQPALLAETTDRRLLDSAFLSRGTQEQLYLAMRFALCDAASPDQPLPLLLDDLFVHFDEGRLANTLPVLESLASTRQVLLFTCHARVAQTIAEGIPSARVLNLLDRGQGA